MIARFLGRLTADGGYLAVHGSAESDRRGELSTFAIVHAKRRKASLWLLRDGGPCYGDRLSLVHDPLACATQLRIDAPAAPTATVNRHTFPLALLLTVLLSATRRRNPMAPDSAPVELVLAGHADGRDVALGWRLQCAPLSTAAPRDRRTPKSMWCFVQCPASAAAIRIDPLEAPVDLRPAALTAVAAPATALNATAAGPAAAERLTVSNERAALGWTVGGAEEVAAAEAAFRRMLPPGSSLPCE